MPYCKKSRYILITEEILFNMLLGYAFVVTEIPFDEES